MLGRNVKSDTRERNTRLPYSEVLALLTESMHFCKAKGRVSPPLFQIS